MKSCLTLSLCHSITCSFTLPFLSCSHMYIQHTHTHTLYYLQKHKLRCWKIIVTIILLMYISVTLSLISPALCTPSLKLLLLHHSFIFLSLCVSLSFLTLHLHYIHYMVMLCSVHYVPRYWVYIGVHYVFLFHQKSLLSESMSLNLTSPVLLHSIQTVSL